MFSLVVEQRGLEDHAAIQEVFKHIEVNGVMHQGLGAGVARVITTGATGGPTVLCELNQTPGYQAAGHIASLAHSTAGGTSAAAAELAAVLKEWSQHHPQLPLAIGQEALKAHLQDGRALTPQGVYIAAGTKLRGTLVEAHSPQWNVNRRVPLRSITKALVCATILTLQDRGLLDIDQPLAAHLPEWGDTPEKAVITLKHVMCHTSGIPNVMGQLMPVIEDPHISLAESSRRLAEQPLQHALGEFNYNNPAYNLLGAVAEKVTGSSWYQIFQEAIAGPLGMEQTYFVNVFSDEVAPSNPSLAMGAVSTAADMLKFLNMLMHHGTLPDATGELSNGICSSSKCILSAASYILFMEGHSKGSEGSTDRVWNVLAAPADAKVPPKVQVQIDSGLLTKSSVTWGLQEWAKPQYALGSWVNCHSATGKRSVSWVSSYNSHLSIHDLAGDDPVWVLYLAFSQVSDRDNLPGIMLQEALERCLQSSKE